MAMGCVEEGQGLAFRIEKARRRAARDDPPDIGGGKKAAAGVRAADLALRAAGPGAGSYVSECDYFLEDWKRASWGPHWRRLEAIKRRYDPDGLFIVHHGVGSDGWSSDGFRRKSGD